jgi:ABC-2 type transport system permease protein
VNMRHFRAFLWLRWRLRVNQLRRGGIANIVILVLFAMLIAGLGVLMLVGGVLVGLLAMKDAPPYAFLFVWDGVVVGMLFFWCITLIADLQRSDPLTLDKVLHLPVSPTGAFVINYLSSFFNVTLILFLAGMFGLATGLLFSRGPAMLALFPPVAAFALALTAVTYQFQGWLAALMTNPRRRRTIIVVMTATFILVAQLPNLINMATIRNRTGPDENAARHLQEQEELRGLLTAGKITNEEFLQRIAAAQDKEKKRREEAGRQRLAGYERTARLLSVCLPPGWLPLGAAGAAEGDFLPALLGTLGLGLIGGASLWRGYRTTLRIYTGQYTAGTSQPRQAAEAVPAADGPPAKWRPILLDKRLPWLSEHAQAVALGTFTSLLRAPETKMIMLSPLIMGFIFGALALSNRSSPPEAVRPLIALGSMAMVLLTMQQLAANQFGFDRAGFRVFVLCPAPRREILLGKNIAVAPLPLFWGVLALVAVQCVYWMRIDHFLAAVPQIVSMYLIYCMLANWLSIFAPIPIAAGGFKPSGARLVPALLNMLGFLTLPVLFSPVLLPIGLEYAAAEFGGLAGWPVNLILSVVTLALVVPVYLLMVGVQGKVLQEREQAILKVVTSKE